MTTGPLPHVHPVVAEQFASPPRRGRLHFYPVNLDVKQAEAVRTLLEASPHSQIVDTERPGTIPVFAATQKNFEAYFLRAQRPVSVILDLHDEGRDYLALSPEMWRAVLHHQLQVVYLKLQIHDVREYRRLNALPANVHVLSVPLTLGGSAKHITNSLDRVGERLFAKILAANPAPRYAYDWSWVGGETSPGRTPVFARLREYTSRPHRFVVSDDSGWYKAPPLAYDEYVAVARASRVCYSLNGFGPWCHRDPELLTLHCFTLRQWHAAIDVSPLGPRGGTHWAVFRPEETVEQAEYYLAHDAERERIRDAGHALMREVLIEARWARAYVTSLRAFLRHRRKRAFGALAIA